MGSAFITIIMTNKPQTGSDKPCPTCGLAKANQHSMGQSAVCDGIRNKKIDAVEGRERIKRLVVR